MILQHMTPVQRRQQAQDNISDREASYGRENLCPDCQGSGFDMGSLDSSFPKRCARCNGRGDGLGIEVGAVTPLPFLKVDILIIWYLHSKGKLYLDLFKIHWNFAAKLWETPTNHPNAAEAVFRWGKSARDRIDTEMNGVESISSGKAPGELIIRWSDEYDAATRIECQKVLDLDSDYSKQVLAAYFKATKPHEYRKWLAAEIEWIISQIDSIRPGMNFKTGWPKPFSSFAEAQVINFNWTIAPAPGNDGEKRRRWRLLAENIDFAGPRLEKLLLQRTAAKKKKRIGVER